MHLPPISNPLGYVGLYVYDFGTHVSVGYTAGEIGVLLASAEHADGVAYEIYRVSEGGGFELRGIASARLMAQEAMGFLRGNERATRRDCESLESVSVHHPVPCRVDVHRETLDSFTPPYATILVYPLAASAVLADWLTQHVPNLGDHVVGGSELIAALQSGEAAPASCSLRAMMDYADRPAPVVLEAIQEPIQR
jgi:hypothetical protein